MKCPVLDQFLLPSASVSPAGMQSNVAVVLPFLALPAHEQGLQTPQFSPDASHMGLGGPGLGADTLSPPLALLWAVISRFHCRKMFFTS